MSRGVVAVMSLSGILGINSWPAAVGVFVEHTPEGLKYFVWAAIAAMLALFVAASVMGRPLAKERGELNNNKK